MVVYIFEAKDKNENSRKAIRKPLFTRIMLNMPQKNDILY